MSGQNRLVELQIGSKGEISKRFWLAAPPPCDQLRDAGADETWLARHGRSEFSETGATETALARHSEARADPLGEKWTHGRGSNWVTWK